MSSLFRGMISFFFQNPFGISLGRLSSPVDFLPKGKRKLSSCHVPVPQPRSYEPSAHTLPASRHLFSEWSQKIILFCAICPFLAFLSPPLSLSASPLYLFTTIINIMFSDFVQGRGEKITLRARPKFLEPVSVVNSITDNQLLQLIKMRPPREGSCSYLKRFPCCC